MPYPHQRYAVYNTLVNEEESTGFTSIRRIHQEDTALVPSCCVIFDLKPLSLSFNFIFMSEIFKSLSFCLDHLCRLAILCLDQHAHTLHHLESLITISLDRLDILKNLSCACGNESDFTLEWDTPHRITLQVYVSDYNDMDSVSCSLHRNTGFTAALAILVTGASQSRQHGKSESDSYYLSD
ncbi:hypothetical protein Tco_0052141 [Tanacetum coccineum]